MNVESDLQNVFKESYIRPEDTEEIQELSRRIAKTDDTIMRYQDYIARLTEIKIKLTERMMRLREEEQIKWDKGSFMKRQAD